MSQKFIDNCTMCGAKNVKVTLIDEVDHVCDDCLDSEYFHCDICHEYWHCDIIESFELDNGRVACEHCYEDLEEDE